MNAELSNTKNLLLRDWMKATFLGWLLGFIVVIVLVLIIDATGLPNSQFFVGVGIGAGVGYMQNRVLRKVYGMNWNWMWATIIGMGISFILFDLFGSEFFNDQVYQIEYPVALGGLLTGILQSFVLKKRFGKGFVWIFVSLIAWTTAALLSISITLLNHLEINELLSAGLVLIILVLGTSLSLGSIGGIGLKLILKDSE